MSGLVKRDIIKVMSMTNFLDSALDSAASTLDVCSFYPRCLQLRLRSTAALPQTICNSGSELCRFCVQKRESLRAEFCSSRATEEGSGIFWIMIEFTNSSIDFQGQVGETPPQS